MKIEGKSILFVDDEPIPMEYYTQYLRDNRVLVEIADNADVVLGIVKDIENGRRTLAEFDLIVLDMGMPLPKSGFPVGTTSTRTGAYLLERIRQADDGHIPVILFSQLAERDLVDPAWDVYLNYLTGKNVARVNISSIVERKRILREEFNVHAWLKASYGPISFGESLGEIL